jgi:hypothetical protein
MNNLLGSTDTSFVELFFDVNSALLGAALFYWSKPLARALNDWTVRLYKRFPKLKALPGSKYAGSDLNYKTTYICFRVCGGFVFIADAIFVVLYLRLLHK